LVTENDHEWAARLRASGLPVPDPEPPDAAIRRKLSRGEKVALIVGLVAFVVAQVIASARHDFGHLTAPVFRVAFFALTVVAFGSFAAYWAIAWREGRRSRS
jgi:hypothetical protein